MCRKVFATLCVAASIVSSLAVAGSAVAWAQDGDSSPRARAGEYYAKAQDFALDGNYAKAAHFFELADELIPAPQARRSAIQCRVAAGHHLAAIVLADGLRRRYPDDTKSRALADEVMALLGPRFVRLQITCDPDCKVRVDGYLEAKTPAPDHVIYVHAGRHQLVAHFAQDQDSSVDIEHPAGETVDLAIVPPAAETAVEGAIGETGASDDSGSEAQGGTGSGSNDSLADHSQPIANVEQGQESDREVLRPRAVPLILGGLATAALGGAALWSHRDSLDIERALDDNPGDPDLQQSLDDRQKRTQLLLAGTAASAAVTILVSVIFAKRERSPSATPATSSPQVTIQVQPDHAWVGLRGTY